MSVQILTPGIKPALTNISRSRVSPEWRWAWRDIELRWPFWARTDPAGDPTVWDLAGKHNGSYDGGLANVNQWIVTERGLAISADGSGTDTGIAASDGWDGITGSSPRACVMLIQAQSGSDNQNLLYWGLQNTNEKWRCRTDGGAFRLEWAGGFITSSTSIDDGKLHLCVAQYDGSEAQIWVDGNLEGSDTPSLNTGSGTTVEIIGDTLEEGITPTDIFSTLDIYSRALTPSEITAYSTDPFGPIRPTETTLGFVAAPVAAGDPAGRRYYDMLLSGGL